jgi:hypothetical protein
MSVEKEKTPPEETTAFGLKRGGKPYIVSSSPTFASHCITVAATSPTHAAEIYAANSRIVSRNSRLYVRNKYNVITICEVDIRFAPKVSAEARAIGVLYPNPQPS